MNKRKFRKPYIAGKNKYNIIGVILNHVNLRNTEKKVHFLILFLNGTDK